MAIKVTKLEDVIEQGTIALEGKYLIATTLHDGYTGTHPGDHVYKVIKAGTEYTVVPMEHVMVGTTETVKEGTQKIIFTEGENIFFSARTLDPYDFAFTGQAKAGASKEKAVLGAFKEFAAQNFALGTEHAYHVLLVDGLKVAEDVVVGP